MKYRIAALALLVCSAPLWAESGNVRRNVDLKQKPFIDAATVGQLSANARVDVVARQAAWAQVKATDGKAGWIKALNVEPIENSGGYKRGGLSFLTGSSGSTLTAGAKGLNAGQIKNAAPDFDELSRMRQLYVSAPDAARYANAGHLVTQQVPSIPVSGSSNNSDSSSSRNQD